MNIVIAFPKKELAMNLRKILSQSGYHVYAVCQTGAQVLSSITNMDDEGVVICGSKFVDMVYSDLYADLPKGVRMLLIASSQTALDSEIEDIVTLEIPLKVHRLLETVESIGREFAEERKRRRKQPKQRTPEEQHIIDTAKALLMEKNDLSEEEAHRYMQRRSMENGTGLVEVSQMILSLMEKG